MVKNEILEIVEGKGVVFFFNFNTAYHMQSKTSIRIHSRDKKFDRDEFSAAM